MTDRACRGGAACLPCAVHKGGLVTVSLLAFCAKKCTPPMHGECTIPRCMAAAMYAWPRCMAAAALCISLPSHSRSCGMAGILNQCGCGMAGILNQLHLCAADTCKKFWLAMHTAMHTDPDSWPYSLLSQRICLRLRHVAHVEHVVQHGAHGEAPSKYVPRHHSAGGMQWSWCNCLDGIFRSGLRVRTNIWSLPDKQWWPTYGSVLQ